MIVNTYHVAYERDDSGWWVASIREVRGCHSQGRTIDEARRRVREAAGRLPYPLHDVADAFRYLKEGHARGNVTMTVATA